MADPKSDPHEHKTEGNGKNDPIGVAGVGPAETRDTAGTDTTSQAYPTHGFRVLFHGHTFLEWLTLGLDILTLAVLVLYTYYAGKQWDSVDGQLSAMRASIRQTRELMRYTINQTRSAETAANAATKAANTADENLKSSRKEFTIDQRPYLVTEPPGFASDPTFGKPLEITVHYKDIGRTPAVRVKIFMSVDRFRDDPTKTTAMFVTFLQGVFEDLGKRSKKPGGKYAPLARRDIAPMDKQFSTEKDKTALTAEDWKDIQGEGLYLFCTGVIKYTDAFRQQYGTDFCYFYFGTVPTTWHLCDAHNIIH